MPFDPKILSRVAGTEEVEIAAAGARPVVIWAVVVGTDVYVRSVRGERGGWYRRLVREGRGMLRVGRLRIPVRAMAKRDARTVLAVSLALEQKYRGSGSLRLMLRPFTLPTTLRLDPA